MRDASNWIVQETHSANLGDKRLNKRLGDILNSFAKNPSKSIPNSFTSWSETIAAYRFFNQEKVSSQEILSSHFDATLERIKTEEIVLIPQDTTEFDFSNRKHIENIGYLNSEDRKGFYIHPSIALTPSKLCLGIVDFQFWSRKTLGSRKNYKKIPIEEKESYKWLKGYESANKIALSAPNTTVISIADREGDLYELLEKLPSKTNKAYWIVRCRENRLLLNENDKEFQSRLWDTVGACKPIAELEFNLPSGKIYNRTKAKRNVRATRLVKQEIRSKTVYLSPPERRAGKKLEPIAINVVHCKEINAPSEEDQIEWYLLTSVPINNAETVIQIVEWYLTRWQIELFFKILKSGCKIEELQFDTLKAITNSVAVYSIVAWRILYLTMLGRECPDIDCNLIFEEHEWKSVYSIVKKKKPPKQVPKLYDMILMIAKLGGFLGRKSDGFPGIKTMWIGIQRMKDFALAWQIYHSLDTKTYV